jgi:hypothetical protein
MRAPLALIAIGLLFLASEQTARAQDEPALPLIRVRAGTPVRYAFVDRVPGRGVRERLRRGAVLSY